jgi:hypothetical protein
MDTLETYQLFMPTNVTPQKKRWEIYLCWSFFIGIRGAALRDNQEWWKSYAWGYQDPTGPHTLGLHTSTFCFSINTVLSHKLGASFIVCYSLFLLCFLFIWVRPPCLFTLRESYWRFGLIWFGCIEIFGIKM